MRFRVGAREAHHEGEKVAKWGVRELTSATFIDKLRALVAT